MQKLEDRQQDKNNFQTEESDKTGARGRKRYVHRFRMGFAKGSGHHPPNKTTWKY